MNYKILLCLFLFFCSTAFSYKKVDGPYEWSFPYDHGVHNDYQVEWWYFTGHLKENDETNRYFGFELTFFRIGNLFEQLDLPFSFKNIYVTHFTITDEKNDAFYEAEWSHREFDTTTIAYEGGMNISNGPFKINQKDDVFMIDAKKNNIALKLNLKNSKPIIFHGDYGYHKKTDQEGAASYYYSMTRLKGDGEVEINSKTYTITGAEAWMDHEIFTPRDTNEQFGWDWFAIQFDDGAEMMVYQLRDKDRNILDTASGSYVNQNGVVTKLTYGDYTLTPKKYWKDPKTSINYPVSWRVEVPKLNIDIITKATVNHQVVHPTGLLKQTNYWEGRCLVSGSHTGKAYIELVGY
ncbi:MAG: hypothetical protein CMP39_07300 [Rickettsiales bacterium]|nr:hypothetical protein [Rickettsiales bacterium]